MLSCKNAADSLRKRLSTPSQGLVFNSTIHKYTFYPRFANFRHGGSDEDPIDCDSVTQVVKKYSRPFDAPKHAARVAEREGTTIDEVQHKWTAKGQTAAERGTFVHGYIEHSMGRLEEDHYLSMSMPPQISDATIARLKAFWRWCIQHVEIQQGEVASESRVVHPHYRLAGTVDFIATNYEGAPAIIDWKTNDELTLHGYGNMLPPFQRGKLALHDANLMHYFLQLNIYRTILIARYDFTDDISMVVVHLKPDGTFEEYPVPTMPDHINAILEQRQPC